MPVSSLPRWLFALKALLALVTLALLVRVANPSEVWATLMRANLGWAALALLLAPVNIGLEAYRWARLVRHLVPSVRYRDALRAVVGGYPMGLLTPGRVGDYVGRAVYLREVPPGISAALTFGERMATLAACLIFGLVALVPYLTFHAPPSPLWPAVVGVGMLGTVALVMALLFPSGARTALSVLLPFQRVRKALTAFDKIPPEEAQTLLLLSVLRYGVFTTQFVFLIHAFAPEATWIGSFTAVALVFFAKSAVPQVTLGDLGIRESAAVFFLGAYGVGAAAALDASLAIFAINLLLPALAGVPMVMRLRMAAATRPEPA
ncbi:MAG: lysylphosphatidylglycerol synthase transmembrane domain-containing protein [Bacteroidota bacterium]